MIKSIEREVLSQEVVLKMRPGEKLRVCCETYNECSSACSLVSMLNLRKSAELQNLGIKKVYGEKMSPHDVLISVI